MPIQLLIFISGIVVLCIGGELFIKGSSGTARIFGIKPLIIALVVISFATSSPEFFVSLIATARGSSDLAVGNIVGSCIANIALALGIAALCKPIIVKASILRRELPILFGVTLIFSIMCLDRVIGRLESLILIALFFIFIYYCIKTAKEAKDASIPEEGTRYSRPKSFCFLVVGLAGLLAGAKLLVESSVIIARQLGISELAIGLSVVAIGTALPELATSVIASIRGEGDISIGNIIGSNIFNILAIFGVVSFIRPVIIESTVMAINLPFLILYTFALVPILKTGLKISRPEGAFLVSSYILYLYLTFMV